VFFGEDQEWSVGYKVPVGKSRIDRKSGVREIEEMDLFEYSPVLFGAMPLATSLSSKDWSDAGPDPRAGLAEPAMVAATIASSLLNHLDATNGYHDLFARALGELTVIGNGGQSADAVVTCRAAAAAASRVMNASSGRLQRDALQAATALRMIADAMSAAESVEDTMGKQATDDDLEQKFAEGGDVPSAAARNAGQGPAPTARSVPVPTGVSGDQPSATGRVMAQAPTPGQGSVPVPSGVSGDQGGATDRVMAQASAPDGGGLSNVRSSGNTAPDGHDGAPAGSDRWQYAHQYRDNGQGRCERCGQALGVDLHTGWTPSGANRTPGTDGSLDYTGQGQAGGKRFDVSGWETKIDVPMTGSYEELQRSLRDQANVTLRAMDAAEDAGDDGDMGAADTDSGLAGGDYVTLEATYPDHVIASYTDFDDNPMTTYYSIPWMMDSTGAPLLGTPVAVDVSAVLTAKMDIDELGRLLLEVKAGRVLSAANAAKLKAAHGHLGDVLASAEVRGAKADNMVECPTCKGTGKIMGNKVKCPDCGGSGEVTAAEASDIKSKSDDPEIEAALLEVEALRIRT